MQLLLLLLRHSDKIAWERSLLTYFLNSSANKMLQNGTMRKSWYGRHQPILFQFCYWVIVHIPCYHFSWKGFQVAAEIFNKFLLVIYWLNTFNKVGLSLSKKMLFLLQLKPFKNDEKCSLSNLKRYFHSQGINIFVLTFRSCRRIILVKTRKFCIRRNNNNVDSLETGRIVIAHLLP